MKMKTVARTNQAKPNDDAPPFGRTVRQAREAAGYPTMAALARALGVTPESVWALEHSTTAPMLTTVLRLVEQGGLPLEAFVPPAMILAAAGRLRAADVKGGVR